MGLQLTVVNVLVRDLPTALTFYRHLGVDVPEVATDQHHAEVIMDNGVTLAWDTLDLQRGVDAAWREPAGTRGVAEGVTLEFRLASAADLDARYTALVGTHGYRGHGAPFDAWWGSRYALLDDPDGHTVALAAPPHPHSTTSTAPG